VFEGFSERILPTRRGVIHARVGGSGPPVLLLHGYPQTHLMWHGVADRLAERFTVVAADLPGYGVPTGEVWARADAVFALVFWHWAFLAQPAPMPEHLIGADPDAFFDGHVRALGIGGASGRYPPSVVAAYRALLDDAGTVEAICEDCRAGATIDRRHDDADTGNRRIACPLLVLWSIGGALPRLYGNVLEVWRPWADHVSGVGISGSHFFAEDEPERTAAELVTFLDPGAQRPGADRRATSRGDG
jgi:haloacetate dehalogenase